MLQTSPTQFRNRVFYINSYWNILLIKIGKHALLKHFPNWSRKHNCFNTNYSGTPPYGHLGNTVKSLLQPLFWPPGKNRHAFSCRKTLVNTAKFFWSIGDCIIGVPLTVKQLLKPPDTKARNFWQGGVFLHLCSKNFNSFWRYSLCLYSKLPNRLLGLSGCSSKFQNSATARKVAIIGV